MNGTPGTALSDLSRSADGLRTELADLQQAAASGFPAVADD